MSSSALIMSLSRPPVNSSSSSSNAAAAAVTATPTEKKFRFDSFAEEFACKEETSSDIGDNDSGIGEFT